MAQQDPPRCPMTTSFREAWCQKGGRIQLCAYCTCVCTCMFVSLCVCGWVGVCTWVGTVQGSGRKQTLSWNLTFLGPPLATWLPPQGVSQTLFFPQQSLSHLIIMEKECPFLRFLCFHWSKNLKRAGPCPSRAGLGRSECWAAECRPAD